MKHHSSPWRALTAVGLMALTLANVGCDIDLPMNKNEESLQPAEEKQYMLDTGKELVAKIDAQDFEDLADLSTFFTTHFAGAKIDQAFSEMLDKKYSRSNGMYESPIMRMERMLRTATGMAEQAGSAKRADKEIYSATANLSDIYGRFTPEQGDSSCTWVWDESVTDRLEVAFTDDEGTKWVITLKGSKQVTPVKIFTSWTPIYNGDGDEYDKDPAEESTVVIEVPATTDFVIKGGGKEALSLTVETAGRLTLEEQTTVTYDWDDYYYYWCQDERDSKKSVDYDDLKLAIKLKVGDYVEEMRAEGAKGSMSLFDKVTVAKEKLLETEVETKGSFSNLDPLINVTSDPDGVLGRLTTLTAHTDVLGKLHFNLDCPDAAAMSKAAEKVENFGEDGNFDEYADAIAAFNKTYTAIFYNANSKVSQATLYMEPVKNTEWDEEYFDVKPVICFASDGSVYDVSEYFTQKEFQPVISAFEQLGDDFQKLFGKAFN